ncbi:uncharacterized protein FOMMEDRAFT_161273 [Fomitiporia mediterranea MF3/22]|uniref:uncharacterized protein n=1 Tax=Fomitiporia mediterranea (strain MF3/22) TaxID=694068 RepID=UPI0004408572|nr:uncharacterized protein FOMMEDRAFT_161273 [Fomitiporia mediterranea MF3/22]EJC99050.1 hypothetical protein FOMMEDRAFT_161273 [Fomitiporia mediterranea MF3/22]
MSIFDLHNPGHTSIEIMELQEYKVQGTREIFAKRKDIALLLSSITFNTIVHTQT